MKNRKVIAPLMFALLIFGLTLGAQPALGADIHEPAAVPFGLNSVSWGTVNGTTGSIEIGSTSAFDGAIVAVRCYDLEVSSSYNLTHTGEAGFLFTTGSSQTEFTVYITVDKPAATEAVTIGLYGGIVLLDSLTLQVKDDSLIPDAFLIGLGITLLVLFLIVGIVKRMRS